MSPLHSSPNSPVPKMIDTPTVYPSHALGFSQAVVHGGLLISSGQVGWNTEYELPGDGGFEAQARQCFENISNLLKAANIGVGKVLMLRIYVKDLTETRTKTVSQLLQNLFSGAYKPATSLIGVAALAREALLIEIEVIAVE